MRGKARSGRTWRAIQGVVPAPVRNVLGRLLPKPLKRLISAAVNSLAGAALERRLEQKSVEAVKKTRATVPREKLRADLEALPIAAGATVFIHSSLRSLGFIEGGAGTVVEELCDLFVERRGGTLALPTISVDGTMHHSLATGVPFDVRSTPSGVGKITEMFRLRPGVRRSVHPTHSVAALGPRAEWLTAEHHRCGSTFGRGSPYQRLIEADGVLLGLGVDLGPVTFYHVIEDLRGDFPLDVYSADSPFQATCVDGEGKTVTMNVMAHEPSVSRTRIDTPGGEWIRAFLTRRLEQRGALAWHPVGEGQAWIIRARDMYEGLEALLEEGVTIYTTEAEWRARNSG